MSIIKFYQKILFLLLLDWYAKVKFTKAKAIVAAVGTFVEGLKVVVADELIQIDEVPSIVSTVVILAITVWGVFKVPNRPVSE
jgi:hypothetical protein